MTERKTVTREELAAALHDEFWGPDMVHAIEAESGDPNELVCGDMERGSVERIFAALPESADETDWTALANDIRAVDGNHDLGAGELAARLIERGWRRALPESADEGLLEALNEAADYIADVATDSDGMDPEGFALVEKLRALAATQPATGGEGS